MFASHKAERTDAASFGWADGGLTETLTKSWSEQDLKDARRN